MDQKLVTAYVQRGLEEMMEVTSQLWPQRSWQLPERNLSLYVSMSLRREGFAMIQEWPLSESDRLDAVAYQVGTRTLILLEAKRLWSEHSSADMVCLADDVRRIGRNAENLRCWNFAEGRDVNLSVNTTFGVVLASGSGKTQLKAEKNRIRFMNELTALFRGIDGDSSIGYVPHRDGTYFALYGVWVPSLKVERTRYRLSD